MITHMLEAETTNTLFIAVDGIGRLLFFLSGQALHSLAQQSMGHALSVAAHPNELLTRGSPADIDSRAAMDPPDMDQTTHIPDGRHNTEPDDDSADDAD